MTEKMIKENFDFLIKQQEKYKDDEVNWAYFEGQIAMLIMCANTIFGYERVREIIGA